MPENSLTPTEDNDDQTAAQDHGETPDHFEGNIGANIAGGRYTNRPYLVRVIREALEQHATPRRDKPGCSICAGALAALNQLEEAS